MRFHSLSFTLLCLTITHMHASSQKNKEEISPVTHHYSLCTESYQTDVTNKSTNKRKLSQQPVSTSFQFISADRLLERYCASQPKTALDHAQIQERTAKLLAQTAQFQEYMFTKYPHLIKP
ncbi:MAG: hypothetical protein P4L31_02370, partial [Candidatus Babeliales bacterium]|nr:hypothetical protein [Candidatus Babeliales bacterium]